MQIYLLLKVYCTHLPKSIIPISHDQANHKLNPSIFISKHQSWPSRVYPVCKLEISSYMLVDFFPFTMLWTSECSMLEMYSQTWSSAWNHESSRAWLLSQMYKNMLQSHLWNWALLYAWLFQIFHPLKMSSCVQVLQKKSGWSDFELANELYHIKKANCKIWYTIEFMICLSVVIDCPKSWDCIEAEHAFLFTLKAS